jgi:nucleotide-binding universal stress UspA family protein
MTIKSIMTQLGSDADSEARLNCALNLAKAHNALLIGVACQTVPPMTAGPWAGVVQADWYVAASKSVKEAIAKYESSFWAAVEGLPRGGVFESGMDYPAMAMARAARQADLIIASPPNPKTTSQYLLADASELVITSGRPVLVTPTGAPPLKGERVLIAWKDTREARRAMMDALPLLVEASLVTVLEIAHKDEHDLAKISVGQVAEALRRHGVSVQAEVAEPDGHAGTQIMQEARKLNADLVVAGGYGHSRLGEWVLGGVTRDLLHQDHCHVLLSH